MSDRIKEIRKESGLSKIAFAKMYNIPISTVSNWEWGQRSCPNYVVELLDRAVTEDLAAGKLPGSVFDKNPPATVAERLKYLREEVLEISLAQLGEKIGITKGAVHQIEKGMVNLSEKNCSAICSAFCVNKNWLLNGVGDPLDR